MNGQQRFGKPGGKVRRQTRGNPRLQEEIHDPYRTTAKLRAPRRCAQCGATYLKGRWQWQSVLPTAPATIVCPACRRSNEKYPAGELTLRGAFVAEHDTELVRLIRNIEAAESREHPLHRIMALQRSDGSIVITTTDVHLPRRMGHALEDAWGGELSTHYDEQGYFARVTWERND
jgi:NMD protein affecting ribosome stability and mRNA decay